MTEFDFTKYNYISKMGNKQTIKTNQQVVLTTDNKNSELASKMDLTYFKFLGGIVIQEQPTSIKMETSITLSDKRKTAPKSQFPRFY